MTVLVNLHSYKDTNTYSDRNKITYANLSINIYTCMDACIWICVHMHAYAQARTHTHTHTHTCTHTSIQLNPEFYSAWNFRRQILSSFIKSSPDTVIKVLVHESRGVNKNRQYTNHSK